MTTRILESFNVLDRHSKSVFSKYAKVNHLTSVPESDFQNEVPLSKSKTEIAFVSEDTRLSLFPHGDIKMSPQGHKNTGIPIFVGTIGPHNVIITSPPKKVAHVVSMKAISSKVSIRPFTSPEDLALRRSTNVEKDKEGFRTTTLKKPVRPSEPTIHRMKWSKEVKKMPPLDIMSKASSTVLVGGALNHTKTSQWCSSQSNNSGKMLLSAMKEDNEPFIVPASTGEVIAQQLHLGNVVRIGTNEPYKRANKNSPIEKSIYEDFIFEPVPLCFDDELERKNVKVLTARSPTVYKDLPIVSETYPLISDQNQYEPFKSPGLHILDTSKSLIQNPDSVLNCKVGIIRMSYSLRKASTVQSMRKSQRGPQIRHKTKRIRSVHVLSADGNVVKNASEGPLVIRCHDAIPSSRAFTNTSKSPAVPLPMPRQRRIAQTPVGLVVNGINPQNAERSPSDNLKTTYKMTKGRLQAAQSQRPVATQNGMDFIVISRPLQSGQNLDFVAKQRCQEEFWSTKQDNISHNYEMSRVLDDEKLALNVESFSVSRPNSSVDHPCQDGAGAPEISTLADPHSLNTMDEGNTCLETICLANDSETPEANCYLQWSSAINIPTAGCD